MTASCISAVTALAAPSAADAARLQVGNQRVGLHPGEGKAHNPSAPGMP